MPLGTMKSWIRRRLAKLRVDLDDIQGSHGETVGKAGCLCGKDRFAHCAVTPLSRARVSLPSERDDDRTQQPIRSKFQQGFGIQFVGQRVANISGRSAGNLHSRSEQLFALFAATG